MGSLNIMLKLALPAILLCQSRIYLLRLSCSTTPKVMTIQMILSLWYVRFSIGYGMVLDTERYNWLISELDKGQAAGYLMIIAAHVPIGVEPAPSMMCWNPASEVELDRHTARILI